MRKFLILSACLWLLSNGLLAQQSLTGRIESARGEPIAYATIQLLNTARGTVSDANGYFVLPLPATGTSWQVEVRALGYARLIQRIEPGAASPQVLQLQSSAETLDEVLVSALRSEQAALEVPIAITALSEQQIKQAQVWSLNELNSLIPNYYVGEYGVGFQQIQGIRGIQVFSENPAIATYIDGVNQLDIIANGFLLTDIERIEVLRGPQGTLFGRNAMGGVVNIITKKPGNVTSGFAELSVGNLGLQRYGLGLKTPLIANKLFLGLTGQYQSGLGYLRADTTGTPNPDPAAQGARIGDEESLYGNLTLRWLASDQLDLSLNVKAQIDDSDASNFFITQRRDEAARDPDQVGLGYVGEHRRDIVNTALTANYSLPGLDLSSVSTYQRVGLAYAGVSWPYFFAGTGSLYSSYRDGEFGVRGAPQQVFTQELKLRTNQADARLQATAGLFYFYQNAFEPTTNIGSELLSGPFAGPVFVNTNEGKNTGFAAFGQLSYDLSPQLTLTAGLRYDYEERDNTFNDGGLTFVGGEQVADGVDTTVNADFEAFSPKLSLAYQLSDDAHLYASYSRGFRAGGINTQFIPGFDLTYDPEYSDNFELGYKQQLLGQKLRLQVVGYHIRWSGIQFFSQVSGGIFVRDNLGDARTTGLEVELRAKPLRHLTVDLAYGTYLEASYEDFSLQGRFSPEPLSLEGNTLPNTPAHTLFMAATYQYPISDVWHWLARLELRSMGEHYSDVENQLRIDSYQLLNTRLGIGYKGYELQAWVNNLSNQRYIGYGSPSTIDALTEADFRVLMSAPQTYGITFTARF